MAGVRMSNLCFNYSQWSSIPDRCREQMAQSAREWDEACGAVRKLTARRQPKRKAKVKR